MYTIGFFSHALAQKTTSISLSRYSENDSKWSYYRIATYSDQQHKLQMCAVGKQTMSRIPKERTSKSIEVLPVVHSNICALLCIKSLSGVRYFLTFINDFSKMTFVYFLHKKSDAFKVFTQLHQEMERQTCKKFLTLRTDNNSEFTSQEFMGYCASHAIGRQLSQPYFPH